MRISRIIATSLILSTLAGCKFHNLNSVSGDLALKNAILGTQSGGGGSRFSKARDVLVRRCATCHEHNAFGTYSEGDFISHNLVIPGSAFSSLLYSILRGVSSSGRMPPVGNDPIPSEEADLIRDWINGISNPISAQTQRRLDALQVISVSCANCHQTTQVSATYGIVVPAFANFSTDDQFTNSTLAAAGNPTNSWLYQSLAGSGGPISSMPSNGSGGVTPLSSSNLQKIRDWIQGMGSP